METITTNPSEKVKTLVSSAHISLYLAILSIFLFPLPCAVFSFISGLYSVCSGKPTEIENRKVAALGLLLCVIFFSINVMYFSQKT